MAVALFEPSEIKGKLLNYQGRIEALRGYL